MHVGDILPHSVGLDCQSEMKTAKVFSLTSQSLGLSMQHLASFSRYLLCIYSSCGGGR